MASPIINIKFLADLKGFSSQMQNANRTLAATGKKLQSVGTGLSLGVTAPLVALGAIAVSNFDKQAKAIAQVEAGLRSTGNAVGFTTDQLVKQAGALQNNSLFGDEDILKDVTAQLLTFTNISGNAFERTSLAALDLATRLDGDLKSASIQLGKALNDPVANLSALSRSGIQFSESQKATINSLVETNRLADAQTIILDELANQYGGSAEAAAKAGTGPLKQLQNILGDLTEDFGKIIIDGIAPFVDRLKQLAIGFGNLSPATKKFIFIVAGVAAAIGPLLALAGTILPAIGAGFALLTGPIGLIIAGLTAVGVVIYKNWEPIKKTLLDIANYFVDLYNESTVFRAGIQAVILTFKNLFEVGKFIFETLKNIISGFIENFVTGFKSIGAIIKAVFTGNFSALPGIINDAVKNSATTFKGFTTELAGDWKTLTDGIETNGKEAIANITTRAKLEYFKENVNAEGITDAVKDATIKGMSEGVKAGTGTGKSKLPTSDDLDIEDSKNDVASLGNLDFTENPKQKFAEALANTELVIFDEELTNKFNTDLQTMDAGFEVFLEGFNAKAERLAEIGAAVGDSVGGAFEDLTGRIVDSLGLANSGFQGFVKGLAQTVIKLLSIMLAQSISQSIAGATASGLATGPAAIFTTPAFIATAVGGVLAAFASIPKFATGVIVDGSSFYGDKILARVNSGELILNKDQQRSLYNSLESKTAAPVVVGGRMEFDGRKMAMVLEEVETYKNRVT